MDEKDIRLQARLQALEYLLCNVYARQLYGQPGQIADEKQRQQKLLTRLEHLTVPGVDPVQSDVAV